MSAFQKKFKRIEKKYVIDDVTYQELLKRISDKTVEDKYADSLICNIYFDTPDNLIIRNSIEKPCYKEKLRLRSYGVPDINSTVFLELKKKYKGVVYKRRVDMTLQEANDFLFKGKDIGVNPQIEKEIRYFIDFYKGIAPAMYLSYSRYALVGADDPSLRITFDSDITYRRENLKLEQGVWGSKLLDSGTKVMEIKIPGSMPLWLSSILDELKIFPCSFSKYGKAYIKEFTENNNRKVINCA